jgi:hypothetical protein
MKTGIPVPWVGFGKQSISLCRLSMNNPPTARGWDFGSFDTISVVGGIGAACIQLFV